MLKAVPGLEERLKTAHSEDDICHISRMVSLTLRLHALLVLVLISTFLSYKLDHLVRVVKTRKA